MQNIREGRSPLSFCVGHIASCSANELCFNACPWLPSGFINDLHLNLFYRRFVYHADRLCSVVYIRAAIADTFQF